MIVLTWLTTRGFIWRQQQKGVHLVQQKGYFAGRRITGMKRVGAMIIGNLWLQRQAKES